MSALPEALLAVVVFVFPLVLFTVFFFMGVSK